MATFNASDDTLAYPNASLYVGDLHPDVTEEMLYDIFSTAGPIVSIEICRDLIIQEPLGYAYVCFHQSADAQRALDTLNSTLLLGRPIRIMWAQDDSTLRQSNAGNVFVKNFDKNLDNKSLYDIFSVFGNILSCKIMTDKNGQSKGFGFVCFSTLDEAIKAVSKLNDSVVGSKRIYVALAQKKQESRVHLPGKHNQRSIIAADQEPLTLDTLANATRKDQKQMLGSRLYPLIQSMQPDLAGKITGILLELDKTELLHMLESPELLKKKVDEALAIIQAHRARQRLHEAKSTATTNSATQE